MELNDYLHQFSYGQVQVERDDVKNIEFFLSAFLQFSRNLEIAKWIVKPNDLYDLYNLIYVRPGMKYFTQEKRWRNLIVEAGVGHYLL